MYKVVNAERTAKVDAPSMVEAAAQFLKLPVGRICSQFTGLVDERFSGVRHHPGSMQSAMYCVLTQGLHETDERVAVFEI